MTKKKKPREQGPISKVRAELKIAPRYPKLNRAMLDKQGVTRAGIKKINFLNLEMSDLFSQMRSTNNKQELRKMALDVESIEFELQEAWRFNQDRNKHRYWYKVPHCSCSEEVNSKLFGTPKRIFNKKCIIHGRD